MKLLITNIKIRKAKEAYNNIKIIYNLKCYSNSYYNSYIRINNNKISCGTMSHLHKIDKGEFGSIHSNESYERIDYEEWYKKNEVKLTAIKFGLL